MTGVRGCRGLSNVLQALRTACGPIFSLIGRNLIYLNIFDLILQVFQLLGLIHRHRVWQGPELVEEIHYWGPRGSHV